MKKDFFEKKVYCAPKLRMVRLEGADLICNSGIQPQNEDPEDIEFGGNF